MGASHLHLGVPCWGCQSPGLFHCICTLVAGETYPWNCDLPLPCSEVLLWLLPVFMLQTGKGWCQLLVSVFAIRRPKKRMYCLEDMTVLCHLRISKDRWQFCSVSFAYFCGVQNQSCHRKQVMSSLEINLNSFVPGEGHPLPNLNQLVINRNFQSHVHSHDSSTQGATRTHGRALVGCVSPSWPQQLPLRYVGVCQWPPPLQPHALTGQCAHGATSVLKSCSWGHSCTAGPGPKCWSSQEPDSAETWTHTQEKTSQATGKDCHLQVCW